VAARFPDRCCPAQRAHPPLSECAASAPIGNGRRCSLEHALEGSGWSWLPRQCRAGERHCYSPHLASNLQNRGSRLEPPEAIGTGQQSSFVGLLLTGPPGVQARRPGGEARSAESMQTHQALSCADSYQLAMLPRILLQYWCNRRNGVHRTEYLDIVETLRWTDVQILVSEIRTNRELFATPVITDMGARKCAPEKAAPTSAFAWVILVVNRRPRAALSPPRNDVFEGNTVCCRCSWRRPSYGNHCTTSRSCCAQSSPPGVLGPRRLRESSGCSSARSLGRRRGPSPCRCWREQA